MDTYSTKFEKYVTLIQQFAKQLRDEGRTSSQANQEVRTYALSLIESHNLDESRRMSVVEVIIKEALRRGIEGE